MGFVQHNQPVSRMNTHSATFRLSVKKWSVRIICVKKWSVRILCVGRLKNKDASPKVGLIWMDTSEPKMDVKKVELVIVRIQIGV
jgi:hypothetical protein